MTAPNNRQQREDNDWKKTPSLSLFGVMFFLVFGAVAFLVLTYKYDSWNAVIIYSGGSCIITLLYILFRRQKQTTLCRGVSVVAIIYGLMSFFLAGGYVLFKTQHWALFAISATVVSIYFMYWLIIPFILDHPSQINGQHYMPFLVYEISAIISLICVIIAVFLRKLDPILFSFFLSLGMGMGFSWATTWLRPIYDAYKNPSQQNEIRTGIKKDVRRRGR